LSWPRVVWPWPLKAAMESAISNRKSLHKTRKKKRGRKRGEKKVVSAKGNCKPTMLNFFENGRFTLNARSRRQEGKRRKKKERGRTQSLLF